MYGINGKPYVELDHLIDVEGFAKRHESICRALAKCPWTLGSYGPGVWNSQRKDSWLLEQQLQACPGINGTEELRKYIKLFFGGYNPSRTVYLRKPVENSYKLISSEKDNYWTMESSAFSFLEPWFEKLPFVEVGRMVFFLHEHECSMLEHSDGPGSRTKGFEANQPHKNEFIWIRPNKQKHFYVLDEQTYEKHVIQSHAAFFNSLDIHGGDPTPMMTYSLRVDGVFTEEFRKQVCGDVC